MEPNKSSMEEIVAFNMRVSDAKNASNVSIGEASYQARVPLHVLHQGGEFVQLRLMNLQIFTAGKEWRKMFSSFYDFLYQMR